MSQHRVWQSDIEFEQDVIRVARELWPKAAIAGSVNVANRQRDGIFVTDEAVHIIECTTSRAKQKAADDISKSVKLARDLKKEYQDRPIQCWFITAEEPTADQMSVAYNSRKTELSVTAQSYNSFRGKLIDASSYLHMRDNYAFGSARNIRDGSAKLSKDEYVHLDLLRQNDSSVWSVTRIMDAIIKRALQRAILIGDFGAGKSMTLRELYLRLADAYFAGRTSAFPVYLNLRDHSGQPDPTEVLERHARRIGFQHPHHIVRAWRAGYVVLILDGFDELSSSGWMAFNTRLRQVRFSTVEAIRRFLSETPKDAPVFVAGRASYFDNEEECLKALGVSREGASIFSLNDFSEEQIRKYLRRLGVHGDLPHWLPARPLLVGYLALRGALELTATQDGDPGSGWNELLGLVCNREARTHEAVEAATVRHLIERLASVARSKGGLSAPLLPADMIAAYREVVGLEPDQRAETLLMRLPGLGVAPEGEGARAFIDHDIGGAAAAGDVMRYIGNPYGGSNAVVSRVKEVLSETAVSILATQVQSAGTAHEKIYVSLNSAATVGDKAVPEHGLAADIVKLIATGSFSPPKEFPKVSLKEVILDEFDLTNSPHGLSGVTLNDCVIGTLFLPTDRRGDATLPHFVRCEIEHLEGRAGAHELQASMFLECKIAAFSELPATNAAILDDKNLESGVKALVTVLRKLFLQKGAGRKENAFFRGVPGIGQKTINAALDLVAKSDFGNRIKRGGAEPFWAPNRRMTGRVRMILLSPKTSSDSIVLAARNIKQ
jgi:hypothetical protein